MSSSPPTAQSLANLSETAPLAAASSRLQKTNEILKPLLAFLTPAQSLCNYATLLFRNAPTPAEPRRRDRQLAAVPGLRHPARAEQRGLAGLEAPANGGGASPR